MIHVGGFTPWYFKYVGAHSQHGHEGVATEWETIKVISYPKVLSLPCLSLHAYMHACFTTERFNLDTE